MSSNKAASELLLATGLPYGSAMESTAPLQKWFADRGNKISPVVCNEQVRSTSEKGGLRMDNFEDPCVTPGLIVENNPDNAMERITADCKGVKHSSQNDLSKVCYSLARHLQKHQGILALVLSADTKRSFLECKKHDLPLAIQLAYRFAGKPSTKSSMSGSTDCIIPSTTSPLLDTLKLVLPALRDDRTVVILAPLSVCRTISVLMEILIDCGLPKGAVNFLVGGRHNFIAPVDTLYLCGSRDEDQEILAEASKPDQKIGRIISTQKSGSTAIITDCADLHSAVTSLVEAACFSNGQSPFCPSKILIQESILEKAIQAFKSKISTLRSGSHWDKSVDYSDFVLGTSATRNIELIETAQSEGTQVFSHIALDGDFQKNVFAVPGQAKFPLVGAINLAPTSPLLSGKYEGPLLAFLPFRTIKEAVSLSNNGPFTTACSVWSDSSTQAMEIARSVKAFTVWINSCHLYEAVFENPDHAWSQKVVKMGAEAKSTGPPAGPTEERSSSSSIDKTYKMFYGGGQKRPENGMSLTVSITGASGSSTVVHIADGGQKDLKNAIDAATSGVSTWKKSTPFNRSQILFYLAENLSGRRQAFIDSLTGSSKESSQKEVDQAIESLFFWAGQCGGPQGKVYQPNGSTTVMTLHEALGTVAIVLSQDSAFLQFITCTAAALACGNAVVVIPQLSSASSILEFCQVLESSDVPAGVVNVVTGNQDNLTKMLALHPNVAAVWASRNSDVTETSWTGLQKAIVSSGQKLWAFSLEDISTLTPKSVRQHATRPKHIWIPTTESFAN